MRRTFLVVALALSALPAYGQLDSNSITVTAARSSAIQPDQVVFVVSVTSGLDANLDNVTAALSGTGITAANFSGINSGYATFALSNPMPPVQPTITWNFTLPVSIGQLKTTAATLTALQQNIGKNDSGLTLSFAVQGTQVSVQLQQSQACSVADLISDARAQAQKIASAAGFNLGGILAISGVTSSNTASPALSSYLAVPACTLTVKFGLVRLS